MKTTFINSVAFALIGLGSLFSTSCSTLSNEAKNQGQSALNSLYTKCGDSYYTMIPRMLRTPAVKQCKNVSIEVVPDKLGSSDELNGIEWKGGILVRCEASREATIWHKNSSGVIVPDYWEKWKDDHECDSFRLIKKKGRWLIIVLPGPWNTEEQEVGLEDAMKKRKEDIGYESIECGNPSDTQSKQ